MDIAKEILANVEAHPTQKALAQHAFEVSPHERALAGMLQHISIPIQAKADLWDAKKNASINPKLHQMLDIANLPSDLLDKAESHPNVLKTLLAESKPSEAKGTPKASEKAPKGEEKGNKEAKKTTSAAGATNEQPEEAQEGQAPQSTDPNTLPPLPTGHIHIQATDGSEHYVPHENLGKVAQLDPGIKILRTEQQNG